MGNFAISLLEQRQAHITDSIRNRTQDIGVTSDHLEQLKAELSQLKGHLKDVQDAITLLKQTELYGD